MYSYRFERRQFAVHTDLQLTSDIRYTDGTNSVFADVIPRMKLSHIAATPLYFQQLAADQKSNHIKSSFMLRILYSFQTLKSTVFQSAVYLSRNHSAG